jgi:hypothetical protein
LGSKKLTGRQAQVGGTTVTAIRVIETSSDSYRLRATLGWPL